MARFGYPYVPINTTAIAVLEFKEMMYIYKV